MCLLFFKKGHAQLCVPPFNIIKNSQNKSFETEVNPTRFNCRVKWMYYVTMDSR